MKATIYLRHRIAALVYELDRGCLTPELFGLHPYQQWDASEHNSIVHGWYHIMPGCEDEVRVLLLLAGAHTFDGIGDGIGNASIDLYTSTDSSNHNLIFCEAKGSYFVYLKPHDWDWVND